MNVDETGPSSGGVWDQRLAVAAARDAEPKAVADRLYALAHDARSAGEPRVAALALVQFALLAPSLGRAHAEAASLACDDAELLLMPDDAVGHALVLLARIEVETLLGAAVTRTGSEVIEAAQAARDAGLPHYSAALEQHAAQHLEHEGALEGAFAAFQRMHDDGIAGGRIGVRFAARSYEADMRLRVGDARGALSALTHAKALRLDASTPAALVDRARCDERIGDALAKLGDVEGATAAYAAALDGYGAVASQAARRDRTRAKLEALSSLTRP